MKTTCFENAKFAPNVSCIGETHLNEGVDKYSGAFLTADYASIIGVRITEIKSMNIKCLLSSDSTIRGKEKSGMYPGWLLVAITLFITTVLPGTSMALEVPDFEKLVNEQGSAVVKISVTGSRQQAAVPGFDGQQLPEPFRRYFENLPQQPDQRRSSGFGSGFVISDDGFIVTNAHVVDNASEITVALPDRREYVAELIGSDERSDIALLKVDATGLPALTLGDSTDLNVGQWVLAIGSPFGFEYTATQGIISAVSRSLPDENYVPFIQTDAAVNPGNSGGPLFDTNGEVIGVNSQIFSRSGGYQGLSFAIPVNVVKSVVAQLKDNGYVSRGWLGVLIQNVDRDLAQSFGLDRPIGALVSKVTEQSPAEAAGLQPGDIILSLNGIEVERSSNLPPLVGLLAVGDIAELKVLRKGERIVLPVTIAELEGSKSQPVKTSLEQRQGEGKLGLVVSDLTSDQRSEFGTDGVIVEQVEPSSPAAAAGVRQGDVVISFNQTEVTSVKQLVDLVSDSPTGRPLPLLIQRGDSPLYSALTLQ